MGSSRCALAGFLVAIVACGGERPPAVGPTRAESASSAEVADVDTLVRSALEAQHAGDYQRSLELSLQAEALLPDHPTLVYNTACALALTGRREAALDRLERLNRMGIALDLEAGESLRSLHGDPRFEHVLRAMAAVAEPLERSSVAYTIPDPTFLVEGVAHDPMTGDLLLSSLYQRRIVRVTPDGRMLDLTRPSDDLWSMLGMVVDSSHGWLWTVTVGGPHMRGAAPDEPLRSALVKLSLADGAELARFEPPAGSVGAALDSLAVARDGTVYVSDSGAGAVHRLPPGGQKLEILAPPGTFISTQGVELSADQSILYVADYGRGPAAVDVATGETRFLEHDGLSLVGIDGLERHGSDLIAIQNGIRPQRVVRIVLGPDGLSIARVDVLERSHHLYREPTLGTVVGDDLFYVAASQWRAFDDNGDLLRDQLIEPSILRLPLGD